MAAVGDPGIETSKAVAAPIWSRVPLLTAGLGFVAALAAYYPGMFNPDSIEQFDQSRSGHFMDWHPPIMALLWFGLNKIQLGPQLLLILHLMLFWSALCLVGAGLLRAGSKLGAAAPLAGFLPPVFVLVGVLANDVELVAAWLLAAGLVFESTARSEAPGIARKALIVCLFIYGAFVRTNAVFAAPPLVYYGLTEIGWGRQRERFLAALVIPVVLLVLSGAFGVTIAKSEHPGASLLIFDIGSTSQRLDANLLPGKWSAADAKLFVHCGHPDSWDAYATRSCAFATQKLQVADQWGSELLLGAWLAAIWRHPAVYAEHRLIYSNDFFRWLGRTPVADIDTGSEIEEPAFQHSGNRLSNAYAAVVQGDHLYLRPYFWLIVSLGGFVAASLALPSRARRFSLALSSSAALYLLGYVVVGVGTDYRYSYWSICAALCALIALAACDWRQHRAVLAVLLFAVILAFGVGASIISSAGAPVIL